MPWKPGQSGNGAARDQVSWGEFAAFLNDSSVRETMTERYLKPRINHIGGRE